MADEAKARTALRALLLDAIDEALDEHGNSNHGGKLGYISDDTVAAMTDAAMTVFDYGCSHEKWLKENT